MPLTPAWHGLPTWRDPRLAVAAILALYVGVGITLLGFNRTPLQVVTTVGAAVLLDMVLHALLRRSAPMLVPFSALITGLGLAILVNYAHGLWLALVPVTFAIVSKYLLTFRGRHIYNPALFGVVASLVLGGGLLSESPEYQWGGSTAVLAFVVTLALMLFVLR
jgi:Na+-transporting NADH:ubiquinone oxidoreductase subunit NqrB